MSTIILKHVKAKELPSAWRKKILAASEETVTVTLTKEPAAKAKKDARPNHSFGMWADREDLGDAAAYVRRLRQPRQPRK